MRSMQSVPAKICCEGDEQGRRRDSAKYTLDKSDGSHVDFSLPVDVSEQPYRTVRWLNNDLSEGFGLSEAKKEGGPDKRPTHKSLRNF
ncbi:hypothetical protein AA103581_2129 [Gluconobacter wancherniae NBRC 103581]|nr:hypothetical protein AA103581_2129 [Gluconobacter wancherniae NBRC 103581]